MPPVAAAIYKKKAVYNVIDNGRIPFIMSDKF